MTGHRVPDRVPSPAIASAYRRACLAELGVIKPGNVHIFAGGHGMDYTDMRTGADASAPMIAMGGIGIGQRIWLAQRTSFRATGCNTNLGIILLAAPLIQAAQRPQTPLPAQNKVQNKTKNKAESKAKNPFGDQWGDPSGAKAEIKAGVKYCLESLDRRDTRLVYRAIRGANPGGLGQREHHDIRDTAPSVSLVDAMASVRTEDRIAAQYANHFHDVFDAEKNVLESGLATHGNYATAILDVYFYFLTHFIDSHIRRKHGIAKARQIRREALSRIDSFRKKRDINILTEWDRHLKERRINPGTSADFTVAVLLVHFLGDIVGSEGK